MAMGETLIPAGKAFQIQAVKREVLRFLQVTPYLCSIWKYNKYIASLEKVPNWQKSALGGTLSFRWEGILAAASPSLWGVIPCCDHSSES